MKNLLLPIMSVRRSTSCIDKSDCGYKIGLSRQRDVCDGSMDTAMCKMLAMLSCLLFPHMLKLTFSMIVSSLRQQPTAVSNRYT